MSQINLVLHCLIVRLNSLLQKLVVAFFYAEFVLVFIVGYHRELLLLVSAFGYTSRLIVLEREDRGLLSYAPLKAAGGNFIGIG